MGIHAFILLTGFVDWETFVDIILFYQELYLLGMTEVSTFIEKK